MKSIENIENIMSFKLWQSVDTSTRKFRSLNGHVIVLEGLIGVGKTTLGFSLEKYLNELGLKTKFYPEFKNKALLNQYITNMDKYAYVFQTVMLMARINIYRQAYHFASTGGISIIDRSLLGDYTFAKMQYNQDRFTIYEWEVYRNLIPKDLPEPNCIVMLKCKPEIAFNRMKKRGNKSEVSGYTLKYFKELSSYYNDTFKNLTNPTLSIDWETNKTLKDGVGDSLLSSESCNYVLNQIWEKMYLN